MLPVTLLALDSRIPLSGLSEHCVSLSSPSLRKWIQPVSGLEREVALVPDQPTEEDAKALAFAMHADAARVGDEWRLFRSAKTSAELRKADVDWLQAQMEATASRVDALVKASGKSPTEAPLTALRAARRQFEAHKEIGLDNSAMAASGLSPGGRLLVDLLRRVPRRDMQAIAPGTEAMFSDVPVGSEIPLNDPGVPVQRYIDRQAAFSEWAERALGEEVPEGYRWAFPKGPFRPGPRTVQLSISRLDPEPSFGIGIYDAKGAHEVYVSTKPTGFGMVDHASARVGLGRAELSAEATARSDGLDASKVGAEGSVARLDPTLHEPLDSLVRPALVLWAKARGFGHVVGCIPDSLLASVPVCVHGNSLDLDALATALERDGVESVAQGETLVMRPKLPLAEEASRVDRRPLATLYRQASRGRLRFEDLCAYHAAYAGIYGHSRALPLMERPIRDAFALTANPNWGLPHILLVLVGKLDASEQARLAAGAQVPLPPIGPEEGLRELARSVAENVQGASDLDLSSSRILSKMRRGWLAGAPGGTSTLVRRVARGDDETQRFDPVTRETTVVRGKGLVFDDRPVPLSYITAGVPQGDAMESLDRRFLFLWMEERMTQLRVIVENFLPSDRSPSAKGAQSLRLRCRLSRFPASTTDRPEAPRRSRRGGCAS